MKQITFRELLNLMYEGKAPKRIRYCGKVYQEYRNDYRNATSGLLISDVIGRNLPLGLMAGNVCITIYDDILDEKEKEYLSNIIMPFKKYVIAIEKIPTFDNQERIIIEYHDYLSIDGITHGIVLPTFKKGTMYRGMKLYKEYTVEELGL